MKGAKFSPKPASILEAITFLIVFKKTCEIYKVVRRSLIVEQNVDYFI
jgi:hypothetical protein